MDHVEVYDIEEERYSTERPEPLRYSSACMIEGGEQQKCRAERHHQKEK
jgi:hypothetical protein